MTCESSFKLNLVYIKQFIFFSCTSAYYSIPDGKDKRSAGFGYGTKLDFTKHNTVTPSPNAYSIKSIFQADK